MGPVMNLREVRKRHPDKPPACQECRFFLDGQSYKIPFRFLVRPAEWVKDSHGLLLLVCMNPGRMEDKAGQVLIGPTGKRLMAHLAELVSKPNPYMAVVATNAVKCYADPSHLTKQKRLPKRNIQKCAEFLVEDIIQLDPECILFMGADAQLAHSLIQPQLGPETVPSLREVVYCPHPSYELYGGSNEGIVDGIMRTQHVVNNTLVMPPGGSRLEEVLNQLEYTKRLGLDFEWDPATMKVHTIGLATKDYAWAGEMKYEYLQLLRRLLNDPNLVVHGHDLARAEIRRLIEFGIDPKCKWKDSMVMLWELKDRAGNVALKDIAYRKLMVEKYWGDEDYTHYSDDLALYCSKDAWTSLYLVQSLEEAYEVELEAMWDAHCLDMELLYPMAYAMHRGIKLDEEQVNAHYETIGVELAELEPRIQTDWDCEPSKAASILLTLQKRWGIRPRSTQKEMLQALLDEADNVELVQFLTQILHFRMLHTLYTRYLVGLPSLVEADGCIHPYLQTAKTNTGRPAASSPNVLNLPKNVRDMFMTKYGDAGELVSRDRSQSEYRCAVYLSGHKDLIKAYQAGADMHSWAAELAGIDRRQAKILNFGALYYAKDAKLMSVLLDGGLSSANATTALRKYRKLMSVFTEWQEQLITESKAQGYVVAPDGGRGYRLKPTNIVNFPVQRWSATLNKQTLVYFFREMRTHKLESHIWLDYYDSVETDQLREERDIMEAISAECFQELPDVYERGIRIPFPLETTYHGTHWGRGE